MRRPNVLVILSTSKIDGMNFLGKNMHLAENRSVLHIPYLLIEDIITSYPDLVYITKSETTIVRKTPSFDALDKAVQVSIMSILGIEDNKQAVADEEYQNILLVKGPYTEQKPIRAARLDLRVFYDEDNELRFCGNFVNTLGNLVHFIVADAVIDSQLGDYRVHLFNGIDSDGKDLYDTTI
jgi:hypothetical protein